MVRNKNRAFQQSLCVWASLFIALPLMSACSKPEELSTVLVASSLSAQLERWVSEEARELTWQGAGSQQLRRWVEAGARPLFLILADRQHLEALRTSELISWELTLGCSALSLARPTDERSPREARLSSEAWRAWGLGLQSGARLAVSAEEVPLGLASRELLKRSGARFGLPWLERVQGSILTRPLSASATATLLQTGEVDAALLYTVMEYGRAQLHFSRLPSELSPEVQYIATGQSARGLARAEALKRWLLARPALGLVTCAQAGSWGEVEN